MPTTPVKVVGAVTGCPSSVSASPAGWVASVNCTLRGSMSRVTSVESPALSVARRWKRYQMLSEVSLRVGIVTVPLPPVGLRLEGVGVRVVVEIDPPGETRCGFGAVLGVAGRAAEGQRIAGLEGRTFGGTGDEGGGGLVDTGGGLVDIRRGAG